MRASAATYQVASINDLRTRIAAAVAGDIIIVQNGLYTTSSSIAVNRVGTAANPLTIRAQSVGGVEIAGTHGFSLNSPAAYIIIEGFKFTHAAAINIGGGTSHCRLTRNTIQLAIPAGTDESYVNISGDDAEIDRNELRNKSTLGNMLDVTGANGQVARRLWVHHNYFHDFTSPGGNGAETIRLGLSGLSLSTGNALVEYNLFVRCDGENEMISNKSSGNTYRYNTVLDCPGGEMSQRHGNDCLYYGNYMRNTQGIRVYGDRHKIFSNYLQNNSIGVNMGNGDGDVYNGDPLTSHDRPDDNVVVFNTFINNGTHYQMGGRTGGLGASNTVVANNIFQNGGSMASISSSAPYTGAWSGNIRWQTSSAGNMPASGYTNLNPLLVADSKAILHLSAASPAIGAASGSYAFVISDMDGQPRDANPDIGADEYSGDPVIARILTTNDVGPNSPVSGFSLAPNPPSRSVPSGVFTNASYTIGITDLIGSNAVVTLAVSGLPANTSAGFSPPTVTGSGASTLTVTVSNSASVGYYTLVITGTSADATNLTLVTLLISRPAANLRWASTSSSSWDVNTTPNWFNPGTGSSDRFQQGDTVLFDDTSNLATNISLGAAVAPAVLTNDSNARNYVLGGSGSITGPGGIVKRGTSTLTLGTANDFSGTVSVLGGVLKLAVAGALGSSASVTVINGGTLDINAINLTTEPVIASGVGAAGQGAIVNSGGQQTSALRNVTLAGDITLGGAGRWDLRAASTSSTNGCSLVTSGQPHKIIKIGSNQVSLVAVSVDPALGDIDVKQGVLAIQTVTSQLGNPGRTLTVFPNATLNLWNLNAAPLNKRLVLSNNATIWNESGNSIIIGPTILTNGLSVFKVDGASLTVSNSTLSGPGGLTKTGVGTLTLRGANSFTGPTRVSGGTLALVSAGSLASGAITVDPDAILDVTARADGTLTLASSQALAGNGSVNGALVVGPGAIVSPGASIGTLTVSGTISLEGVTLMELNKLAQTNDVLRGTTIQFGGTLQLANLGGALAAGDSFALFDATTYSGAFTSIVPGQPGPGLRWDTDLLAAPGGLLRIVSLPRPAITNVALIGDELIVSGGAGAAGSAYRVLGSTNLSQPLSAWTTIETNFFGPAGAFAFTNTATNPVQFYALEAL